MKDGVLVQLDTPEELITNPATDYVRAFTKTAPRQKLVTVGKIMLPGVGVPHGLSISASTSIEEAAPRVLRSEFDVTVVDDRNQPVGRITRQGMIAALFPEEMAQ